MKYFHVDAFTDTVFHGNPAAICVVDGSEWPLDARLLQIAQENNLPETAFLLAQDDGYGLRWFSPVYEVGLCGHATLASAFVVGTILEPARHEIHFYTKSGLLTIHSSENCFTLSLPAFRKLLPMALPPNLENAIGCHILELYRGERDLLAVVENAKNVRDIIVDFSILNNIPDIFNLCVTAAGDQPNGPDFVSRLFSPNYAIPEDPVCGSAHCMLTPFWAGKLQKKKMLAHQLSKRGGVLLVEDAQDRVLLTGTAKLYLRGDLQV